MRDQQLVIVGAGIVGLSIALHARRAGYQVTVVDPGQPLSRTSYGNAGVIAVCEVLPIATPGILKQLPWMLLSSSSPLHIRWQYLPALMPWMIRFLKSSTTSKVTAASQALASILSLAVHAHHEIASFCGLDSMLAKTGWLKAYETAAAFFRAENERTMLADLGVNAQNLSSDEIDEIVPGAPGLFRYATMYPTCEQVRTPGKYIDGIAENCRRLGVNFMTGRAQSLIYRDGRLCGVRTETNSVSGDIFILAAGAWSKELARQAGACVPLDTERGYHVMVEHTGPALFHAPVLWSEKSIVLSQFDNAIRITSSVEFAGLHAPPRYQMIEKTLQDVRAAIPRLSGSVSSRWLGFRPSMPDSLPVIGRSPKAKNCFFAFGHGHLGLTLGPITGKLIVQEMLGAKTEIDLRPFSPTRF